MITLNASGGSVTFTFSGNSTYLNDGQITVPVNSLALIIDESDMVTFKKSQSSDIFVSANIAEFGMTKAELESWYKANMVGSTGGGGGVTSGEVQTMIDEAVSGKANSSDVYTTGQTSGATEIANALNAKLDATAYTPTVVDAALSQSSTNPIQNQTLYGELRVGGGTSKVEIDFNTGGYVPEGVTQLEVNPTTTDSWATYNFYNGNTKLGYYNFTNWGTFNVGNLLEGSSYVISGETVIITYPASLGVTRIALDGGNAPWSFEAIVETPAVPLKDVVSGKADSSAVTEEISAAVSGKVNVSDNVVSAHTFNARGADGGSYYTKLKFYGRHFGFNDFHSKKISVFPFGGLNGQLFTSLYLESYNYVSYDAAAYLSGSTNDDYPSSFTSVTWTGDETKMKVEINSEGYLDLIAQGDYWFGQIDSNIPHELYVNILNDIASGQSASVINDSIVNNLENLGNTINGIQYEINGKLDASAYTPINVDSTLSQTSANPIQNKSLFNELRVSGASSGETTIVFVNGESTNYPEGVTVIKFEPTQSNIWASYEFYNGSSYLGSIQVSYYGSISVELSLDGATYTTSGNTVILTVPTTLGINKITQFMGEYSNFTVKVENPPIYTTLKDVVANKQNTLIAGTNITISGNVISAEGGGKVISGGTNISVTTGETADTINCTLPLTLEGQTLKTNDGINLFKTNSLYVGFNGVGNAYPYSICLGRGCNTYAAKTIAAGDSCSARKEASQAMGKNIIAQNNSEHSVGQYNVSNSATTTFGDSGNTLFSIGNGTANDARHNAFEIRQNGDIYLTSGGTDIKLQDYLGGGGSITVDSTLDSGSTNPVENQALYDELRIENAPVETTLTFTQPVGDSYYWTTNYPSGCTTLVGNILAGTTVIELYNNSSSLGMFMIECHEGVIDSVSFSGIEGTYSISGSVVTISYPNTTNVTRFRIRDRDYQPDYQTYKAMATVAPTVLKNQVNDNTTALGGLKLQQISQSDYENLPTKDSSTLYIII